MQDALRMAGIGQVQFCLKYGMYLIVSCPAEACGSVSTFIVGCAVAARTKWGASFGGQSWDGLPAQTVNGQMQSCQGFQMRGSSRQFGIDRRHRYGTIAVHVFEWSVARTATSQKVNAHTVVDVGSGSTINRLQCSWLFLVRGGGQVHAYKRSVRQTR